MMRQPSDDSLLFAAARSRDGEAIGQFTRRYAELAYSVPLRMLGDPSAAATLAGALCTEIARRPARVRGEPAVWLHEEATRRAAAQAAPASEQPPRDPAEEPSWDEVRPVLDLAVLKLRRRYRSVLIQHYFQRHGQDELAEILQVTQPVVARRLRAGLEALRKRLVAAGAGCSLAHLMMLLARHAASDAPDGLTADLVEQAVRAINSPAAEPARSLRDTPPAGDPPAPRPAKRSWLGLATVWAMFAGLVAAVAVSYSSGGGDDEAAARPPPAAKPPASRPAE